MASSRTNAFLISITYDLNLTICVACVILGTLQILLNCLFYLYKISIFSMANSYTKKKKKTGFNKFKSNTSKHLFSILLFFSKRII